MKAKSVKSKKAFTLIELMIVIVIIGILSAVILPHMAKGRYQAMWTGCQFNLRSIAASMENYATDHVLYPNDLSALFTTNPPYLRPIPKCPTDKSDYGYVIATDNNNYTVYCEGLHHYALHHVKEDFPQYCPIGGLDPTGY